MKVKCVGEYNKETKQYETHPVLTIGKEYIVLEVIIKPAKDIVYRLLYDHEDSALFDAIQFVVVSEKVPRNWTISQLEDSRILVLSPETWQPLGFWEDYYDDVPESLRIYEQELKVILDEEMSS